MKLILLLCFFSANLTAQVISKSFPISVMINKNKAPSGLRMSTLNPDTTTPYVTGRGFLDMPFELEISSVSGGKVDYDMTLLTSQHYCKEDKDDSTATALANVETYLDGNEFNPGKPWSVRGAIKNKHELKVTFPYVPMKKGVSQVCFGTFVIAVKEVL